MLVLSVVWLATGALLDNVGQTVTSVPLRRKKAMTMWSPAALSSGKIKTFRLDV